MIPIRFERGLHKTRRRGITPRRLAAAKRSLKKQRDKCPLFADQIAVRQPTPEQRIWDMDTQFVFHWDRLRAATCKKWLKLRRIIRKEICPEMKNEFLVSWSKMKYPADPYYASDYLLWLINQRCSECPRRSPQPQFKCGYYYNGEVTTTGMVRLQPQEEGKMCDDVFGDNFNSPGDDFQEDLAGEAGEQWYEEKDNVVDEHEDNAFSANRDECSSFDRAEVFIVGSMIAGNAYEEAIDRRKMLNQFNPKNKRKE